jgi:hypothetical protein
VVLNDGEIIEAGTHDQLLAAKGAYMKLLVAEQAERQSKRENDPDEQHSGEDHDEQNPVNHSDGDDDYGGEYIDPFGRKKMAKSGESKPDDIPPNVGNPQEADPPKRKRFIIRNGAKAGRIQKDIDGKPDKELGKESHEGKKVPLIRLLKEAAPEKWFVLGGSIASMINGLVLPFFAWIFAELLVNLMAVDK